VIKDKNYINNSFCCYTVTVRQLNAIWYYAISACMLHTCSKGGGTITPSEAKEGKGDKKASIR